MRVEAIDGVINAKVIKAPATRVIVYDDHDNPVSVTVKYADGMLYTGHVGDKDFNTVLKMLGVNKTVVMDDIDIEKFQKPQADGIIRL